ncbi:MAG: PQQ-binding-like beta-propeller repeat protein [Anaerolineales bacterium]|jgi:outer membrane protein assembly factor BamB
MRRKITFASIATFLFGLALGLGLSFGTNSLPVISRNRGFYTASANSKVVNHHIYLPLVSKPGEIAWPMAGANPQRTSWTAEEVRGYLEPLWFKPFEPYIPQKVQVIAAYGNLYISTAKGLYALDAATGTERWVYPTELPLGHSPTIQSDVAYVGGFDRKLHAVNAYTGQAIWTFEAEAGFDTNPLVVDGLVYAGNRDGVFYAVRAKGPKIGQMAWSYPTDGPIHFSAAYKDGVVYFASDDSHAYALDAVTGALVWKSDKLPGAGFHSWWPVIYQDRVIFAGSHNYRGIAPGEDGQFNNSIEKKDVFPNYASDPRGTLIGVEGHVGGDWVSGTKTIDMSQPNVTANGSTKAVTEYFEEKPWRRTYFVLDRETGEEVVYDFDQDGKPEYAPVLWFWTHSGTRYPPVIGGDGVIYQSNVLYSDPYIPGGHIAGWKMDTPIISVPNSGWNAVDEPQAYAAGGNLIYWNRCCDRLGAAFDIKQPGTSYNYFVYNLDEELPGYNQRYYNPDPGDYTTPYATFGGPNGVYGFHGDTNPPIPYQGRVYMHRSNAIIAFGSQSSEPVALNLAGTVPVQEELASLDEDEIKGQLSSEIQKIINTGHLRPGYGNAGIFGFKGIFECGDDLLDYWHNASETIYTLLRTLPHISPDVEQQVLGYIQNEFSNYPPYEYNHVGWRDGAPREIFDLPLDVMANVINYPPEQENYTFKNSGGWERAGVWGRNPFMFYALWKYAAQFGDGQVVFTASRDRLVSPPADEVLLSMPHVHNAFIAGYLGYLELEKLAGEPESLSIKDEYIRLLQLRADNFTKDSAYASKYKINDGAYCRSLNVSSNFIFLVSELAQYLRDHAIAEVQEAVDEYEALVPYWFVSNFEDGFAESGSVHLYDRYALFQAKALILQEPRDELSKYLDVPGMAVGDLYYIQNLVAWLEASP